MCYIDNTSYIHWESIISSHDNHIWAEEDLDTRVKQDYQQRFSITFWSGIHDFLIGPHIFSACLTGPVCMDFLEQLLSELLADVLLDS